MLKKFCREYPLLVLVLMLLEMAAVAVIFLGAFTDIPIPARCLALVIGIACSIGTAVIFIILVYEFEKLEMLINIKEELVEDKRNPIKIYKNGELPYEMSDRYLEAQEKANKEN